MIQPQLTADDTTTQPQPTADTATAADDTPRAWQVLRRGLATSTELRRGIGVTIIMALLAAVGDLIVPVLAQLVLDHGVLGPDGYQPGVVLNLALIALSAAIVVTIFNRILYIRLVSTAESALLGLRMRAFEHIHRLSLATHTRTRRGVLVARVTSDVETLAKFMEWGAVSWVVYPVVIAGTFTVMAIYSWQLTLLVVAVHLPLLPFLRWVQRRQLAAYAKVRDRVSQTLGHTSEAVAGAAVIRAYGYTEPVRHKLDRAIDRQYRSRVDAHLWFTIMMPVVDLLSSTALAAVVVVGAWQAADLGLDPGELVAFVFLVRLLLVPIAELGEILDQTQTALAGWWKILKVLDMPVEVAEPEPDRSLSLPSGPLTLEMRGVGFAYIPGTAVLHGINVTVPADSNIAVVGETGSGKTTFARLVTRLADPTEGVVLADGVDLRRADPESRHRSIRMVPQDGFLFDTTVEDNIRFGRPGGTSEDAEAAVDALGLRAWADRLPDGLLTRVGERGERLSVGERQLVALARALVADPGLLVLDEATSAVDPETEQALVAALTLLAEGRTTISIAHRLSTAEWADQVLVFHDGRIAETGTHAQLVAAGGVYARMHESWVGGTRGDYRVGHDRTH